MKQSIATPFVVKSEIVIVDVHDESLQVLDREVAFLTELKHIFQCSMKALVAVDIKQQQLMDLIDEVLITDSEIVKC